MTNHTHRAVIETYAPPSLEVIAAGPLRFCEWELDQWLAAHMLDADTEEALILEVVGR